MGQDTSRLFSLGGGNQQGHSDTHANSRGESKRISNRMVLLAFAQSLAGPRDAICGGFVLPLRQVPEIVKVVTKPSPRLCCRSIRLIEQEKTCSQ